MHDAREMATSSQRYSRGYKSAHISAPTGQTGPLFHKARDHKTERLQRDKLLNTVYT